MKRHPSFYPLAAIICATLLSALFILQPIIVTDAAAASARILPDTELDAYTAWIGTSASETAQTSSLSDSLEKFLTEMGSLLFSGASTLNEGNLTHITNSAVILQSNLFFGVNVSGDIVQQNTATISQ